MFSDLHQCHPVWECWDEDGDRGDSRDVRAMNAESAAEEYAEQWDQDEHDLLRVNRYLRVYVVPKDSPANTPPEVFKVSGEAVATYTAQAE
jgi:hypothetical protein